MVRRQGGKGQKDGFVFCHGTERTTRRATPRTHLDQGDGAGEDVLDALGTKGSVLDALCILLPDVLGGGGGSEVMDGVDGAGW